MCHPSAHLCRVESLPLYNLDSTNMERGTGLGMAHAVRTHYDDCDGFVILHGTDTMSYSAAALSYLMQGLAKPVVLTGAQRPVDKEVTDAKRNLTDSLLYAADGGSFGVSVVFDGAVIAGTRARKSRTKSFNAFRASTTEPRRGARRRHRALHREARPAGAPLSTTNSTTGFSSSSLSRHEPVILRHLRPHYDASSSRASAWGGIPCYERDGFMDALGSGRRRGAFLL
jgi:L-asparaginase